MNLLRWLVSHSTLFIFLSVIVYVFVHYIDFGFNDAVKPLPVSASEVQTVDVKKADGIKPVEKSVHPVKKSPELIIVNVSQPAEQKSILKHGIIDQEDGKSPAASLENTENELKIIHVMTVDGVQSDNLDNIISVEKKAIKNKEKVVYRTPADFIEHMSQYKRSLPGKDSKREQGKMDSAMKVLLDMAESSAIASRKASTNSANSRNILKKLQFIAQQKNKQEVEKSQEKNLKNQIRARQKQLQNQIVSLMFVNKDKVETSVKQADKNNNELETLQLPTKSVELEVK